MKKKGHFGAASGWQHLLSQLPDPGQKGTPFVPDWRSRLGNPVPVSQPGQINVFVVVMDLQYILMH